MVKPEIVSVPVAFWFVPLFRFQKANPLPVSFVEVPPVSTTVSLVGGRRFIKPYDRPPPLLPLVLRFVTVSVMFPVMLASGSQSTPVSGPSCRFPVRVAPLTAPVQDTPCRMFPDESTLIETTSVVSAMSTPSPAHWGGVTKMFILLTPSTSLKQCWYS